jgi:hypothetical protein
MRTAVITTALVATAVLTLAGCGGKEDDVDPAEATAELEQQREDVRAATAELQQAAAATLGGAVRGSSGSWRGCESGGLEEYQNFRYEAGARIDVGSGTARPYLDQLEQAFADAGFGSPEPGERPGGRTLSAERGRVSAAFSELPDQGDYVLLSVSGPCIDVPEDDRDDWLVKDEPTPDIR